MPRSDDHLQVKRVYEKPERTDGTRILVDRLWPRGLSKQAARLTMWLKDIAPSTELRDWFGHDPGRWTEFETRYKAELASNHAAVATLAEYLREGKVTLLYGAKDEAHNNALVLAEYMRKHVHSLR